MHVLFFSRGRGRGHAIPDIAIAKELSRIEPAAKIQFVSYGTGAEVIRQCGQMVIDLKLPEDNPLLETLLLSIRTIQDYEPNLILSHEEFAVPPAARVFGKPCLFLIDWFPSDKTIWLDCLDYADKIIFMDDPGYFDEPPALREKIQYVGPVIRELIAAKSIRNQARLDLELPNDQIVILILPGGASSSTEEKAPILNLVIGTLDLLGKDFTALWVVPDEEREKIHSRLGDRTNVILIPPHLDIDKTMVAADIAITKGTRKTSFELQALGIPSISISYGLNPVDDYRVSRIRTNRALRVRGLTAGSLSKHIVEVVNSASMTTGSPQDAARGRIAAAKAISQYMTRLRLA